jgi:RHS repeat-associated protein
MNGALYTYSTTQPQAVASVGSATYSYDANGNMTNNAGQGLTWDLENRPTAIGAENYVYDGDGNRIEINLGTSTATASYYLGDKLVATRASSTLTYLHQDNLGSTCVTSSSTGALISSIKYTPFGTTRSGSVSTDKQFTGQRLDGTGLYYYNARYYNPAIGRFVSADSVIQSLENPQTLNRYSYVQNNPLKTNDPTGHFPLRALISNVAKVAVAAAVVVGAMAVAVSNPALAPTMLGIAVNTAVYTVTNIKNLSLKGIAVSAFTGAIAGTAYGAFAPLGLLGASFGGALGSGLGTMIDEGLDGEKLDLKTIGTNSGFGFIFGAGVYGVEMSSGGFGESEAGNEYSYPNGDTAPPPDDAPNIQTSKPATSGGVIAVTTIETTHDYIETDADRFFNGE